MSHADGQRGAAAVAALANPGGLWAGGGSLPGRLAALARLVQLGSARAGTDGFDPGLLADADALLARAGDRLRLNSCWSRQSNSQASAAAAKTNQ